MSPLTHYRIGIALSKAGLNALQLIEAKSRLKFIARNTHTADTRPCVGIELIVPGIHRSRVARGVAGLVEPFRAIEYVTLTVLEDYYDLGDCLNLFRGADEVWLFPAVRQTVLTKSRVWAIHEAVARFPDQQRKYKVIPPWVGTDQDPNRPTKGR